MARKSSPPKQDPYLARETVKYENPIPSREFIMEHLAHVGKPLKLATIAEVLKITNDEPLEALRRRLKAMERDGQLIRNRRNEYGLVKKMDLIRGRVVAHPDGYGFVIPDDGSTDLFLSEKQMRSVMHGDRVLVSETRGWQGRKEGALVEILERLTQEVVGHFYQEEGIGLVQADNRRITQEILIPAGEEQGAQPGQVVVAHIVAYPTKQHLPIGRVAEVIGDINAPGMETEMTIRAHSIPQGWSEEVLAEIAGFTETVAEADKQGREDFRTVPFVTIDGEDSRDFDDAVYCEPRGRGWLLKVAIADVAAYVKFNTMLDAAAHERGNSVYFPNRVVPMLPEILSNGLCSLNPHVDRLCMVCEMAIDMYGRIRRTRFYQGVMRSAARLTYTQVAKVLAGDTAEFPYPDLLPHLQHLHALYQLLLNKRLKRGAIEFESSEVKILFNDQQKITRIVAEARNDAHRLIEEMMLAANVATAEWLEKHEMPLLYRIHEGPEAEKLQELRSFLKELGLTLWGKEQPEAKHYAKLLEKVQDRPDARLIQTVLLRSLRMAIYTPENKGHFGLAYLAYTHFTSPIRRYPDLLVHRAIKHILQSKTAETFPYSENEMQLLGEHCTMTERRAEEASRDVIYWLKCLYMQDKVGECYAGLVTGVTAFGLFVELDGIYVEGLIHVTALSHDYYHFDAARHRLTGERTGQVYRLSDRLEIKVVRVNVAERKIDFELAE